MSSNATRARASLMPGCVITSGTVQTAQTSPTRAVRRCDCVLCSVFYVLCSMFTCYCKAVFLQRALWESYPCLASCLHLVHFALYCLVLKFCKRDILIKKNLPMLYLCNPFVNVPLIVLIPKCDLSLMC